MSMIDHSYLIEQLNQYIIDLINIQQHINKHHLHYHLSILKEKINIKIHNFRIALQQINNKQYNQNAINQMNIYYQNSFTQIVKEAHRLLQIKVEPQGKQKLNKKINLLKQIQVQMTEVWQQKQLKQQKGLFISLNQNLSMLSQKFDNSQLKTIAKSYLHKQFLAIRMIAYKLYQAYMNHTHTQSKQKLFLIKKQQQQLQIQVIQLQDINKQLKNQQKRMIRQLHQLKMINNMIRNRYFTQKSNNNGQQEYNLAGHN